MISETSENEFFVYNKAIDSLSNISSGNFTINDADIALALLSTVISTKINAENDILEILRDCKNNTIKTPIVNALKLNIFPSEIKAKLIAVCWESGLDYGDFLSDFVEIIITGNDIEALEALTLIENMDNSIAKNSLNSNIAILNKEFQQANEQKKLFIKDCIQILTNKNN